MLGKIKIKIFIVALVAALITLMSQATLAYYSTVGKATNVVTSGNIQFIIHEMTDQGKEFPKEGVYIVPGDIVSKKSVSRAIVSILSISVSKWFMAWMHRSFLLKIASNLKSMKLIGSFTMDGITIRAL